MSRSAYIWTVIGRGGRPVAAFTVRGELRDWITRRDRGLITIWRIRDSYLSPGSLPVQLDPTTLEPIEPLEES